METGLTIAGSAGISWLSPLEIKHQVQLVQSCMKELMHEGEHYGVIPGCPKPSLYKPGAEKLAMLCRLIPHFAPIREDLGGGHREYTVTCTLNGASGVQGYCIGSCSTMEKKYRWRPSERKCPACGKPTIIKGKADYGGGWLCFAKKGGCGAKFNDGDKAIEAQATGQAENPDLADCYNTCLKMAQKRAFVGAVLTATAASDIFTQDVEDLPAEMLQPVTVKVSTPVKEAVTPVAEPTLYDFSDARLTENQIEFLKANCSFDEERGLWTCAKDLGAKLAKYRVSKVAKPQEQAPTAKPEWQARAEGLNINTVQDDELPESMGGPATIPQPKQENVDHLKRIQERVRNEKSQKEAA